VIDRKKALEIIKPSEHGLGTVFAPDKRRHKPQNCLDRENEYARWIVEAWEQLLDRHFRSSTDPENALVAQDWNLGKLPAVMRIRVTTPNGSECCSSRRNPQRGLLRIEGAFRIAAELRALRFCR